MIAPGNDLLQVVLAIAFLFSVGYALGRIHQWHRDGARREQAYRNGYDLASNSLFDMATRRRAAAQPEAAARPPVHETLRNPAVGDSRRRIRNIA